MWAWKSRKAARRQLYRNGDQNSTDMLFLTLRGQLSSALNCGQYEAANAHIGAFLDASGMSRTELRKRLRVIGVSITTGKEEYRKLRSILQNDETLHAKKKVVKTYKHLSLCLVGLSEKRRVRQKKNESLN